MEGTKDRISEIGRVKICEQIETYIRVPAQPRVRVVIRAPNDPVWYPFIGTAEADVGYSL